jgi:ATP-binding cassette subfamily F protein 3
VGIGYYAQHVAEALNPKDTVLESMGAKAHKSVTQQEILNLAGALLFSGDDTKKPVSVLSGGEKSRVALGQILLQKAPCLLLDEPTNHLDFQTVEALTQALSRYVGTLIVVSHDRSFIRRIATKILEIRDGRVDYYPGTYDEYVWSCQKGVLAERDGETDTTSVKKTAPKTVQSNDAAVTPSVAPTRKFNYKDEKRTLEREVRKLQKEIGELEAKTQAHQDRMKSLNEDLISQPRHPDLHKWINELGQLQLELAAMEERWLTAQTELEAALQEIAKMTASESTYSE